jgi:hypothetical protein
MISAQRDCRCASRADDLKMSEMWQLIQAARAHARELRDGANAAEAERWKRLAIAAPVRLASQRLTSSR